ncbi:MAG: hypothetical protein U0637_00400 [Phycisphaerales bacterium]
MTTPSINLLPQKRVGAIRARAVARWWVFGAACWAGAAMLAAGSYSVWVSRRIGTHDNSTVISARLEAKRAEKQALTTHVTDLRKRVDAARAVGHHPDWSVMLRYLAVSRPAGLNMDRCELKRVETTTRVPGLDGKPETTSTSTRLVLTISGRAEQISDVHAFVGKVEAAQVFDVVRLGETSTMPPAGPSEPALTKYTVLCELDEPGQGGER